MLMIESGHGVLVLDELGVNSALVVTKTTMNLLDIPMQS